MMKSRIYVGLDNLPKQYDGLFEEASQDSFFLTLPWFRNLEQTVLGPNEVVEIIGVETEEASSVPLGALLLRVNSQPGRLFSQLNIDSLTNYYTSYFAPVLRHDRGRVEDVVKMLAREVSSIRPTWDTLNIRPVDLSLPGIQHFQLFLNELGVRTQTYFCFGNWYLNVAGRSYAEYFKGLPSVIRKNVPYYQRRLEKMARVRIEIHTECRDVERAIQAYETIYNSSWREPEEYPNFIRGFVRTAAEHGWLRLGVCYLDDEPAAAQLWIVHGEVASIYKICYSEKFAKWSVGSVLTARMLEHVLDRDRVREVDYLSGDDSYKANWMSNRRERWGIMAFNPQTVWGNAKMLRHLGGRRLKETWNSLSKDVISFIK